MKGTTGKGRHTAVQPTRARRAGGQGGCRAKSCGASAAQSTTNPEIHEKIRRHPCYSEEAHHHYARMHVAVAPACNIQCNYCNRKFDCANESRPGVVSERLTPDQAIQKVAAVATAIPQMTVVGIAGPGDPLANPQKTFATLRGVAATVPDVQLCLSTNGLALLDHIEDIASLNVQHVTITINAVDPEIGARIYPWIFYNHKRIYGREAAEILSRRQIEGLRMLTERGILCKVNSVMIPGINDEHLIEVNRIVKQNGAFLHNIMPLISAPEHGTAFGLVGQRAPTARELKALQDRCEGGIGIMRHCRQCRADAVGLLGEDRSAEFTLDKIGRMTAKPDPAARIAVQAAVEGERLRAQAACPQGSDGPVTDAGGLQVLVAVATSGGQRINEHFGRAREFHVYEVGAAATRFVGHRRIDLCSTASSEEGEKLRLTIRALEDCHAVFAARIGGHPRAALEEAGIEAVESGAQDYVNAAVPAWFRDYADRIQRGEIRHRARHDVPLRQGAYVRA